MSALNIIDQIPGLPGDDLDEVYEAARAERARRMARAAAPRRAAEVVIERADELDQIARSFHGGTPGTPEEPVPWVAPTGAHDAWPAGSYVTHNGKTWESLTPANVHEPGVSGWREVVQEGAPPPAWVQPAGAHDAYQPPTRVTHNGRVWECAVPNNVWPPGVHGWTDLGPLEDA